MDKPLYLGIDLGTTGVKAGLFDTEGQARRIASREMALDNPAPGFAEFDAERYIGLVFDAIRELTATPEAAVGVVRGIGLSSQAQTFVVLGEDGRPLRPAISWLDVRAAAEAAEFGEASRKAIGTGTDAIASGPKLLWLRRREPAAMARAKHVLLLPDYLIFRLTGRRVSDVRTAESTGCYDRKADRWVDSLLDLCGLRREMMSEVAHPGEAAGRLREPLAADLGFRRPPLAAVGAMDQLAGALGAGNVFPGCGSMAMGTALAIIVTAPGDLAPVGGLSARPHPVRGLQALLAYAKTSGVAIRWFRDNFAPELSYDELFREASAIPVGCDGVACCPHFSGMATPSFDPAIRGAFSGLALSHGRAHLARSLIEALTFTVRQNLELFRRCAFPVAPLRAIGGGARSDIWLQMIADATGMAVERPRVREAACFGAAQLAMAADGAFASVAEASRALYRREREFLPDAALRSQYDAAFERFEKALARIA